MKDVNNWYVKPESEEEVIEVLSLIRELGVTIRDDLEGCRWDSYPFWGVLHGNSNTGLNKLWSALEVITLDHLRDYVKSVSTPAPYLVGDKVIVTYAGRNKGICKIKYIGDLFGMYSNSEGEFVAPLEDVEYKEPEAELPIEDLLLDAIVDLKTDALYVDVSDSPVGASWVNFRAGYGDNLDHLVGKCVGYAVDLEDLPEMLSIEDQAKGILEELVERLGKHLFIKKENV